MRLSMLFSALAVSLVSAPAHAQTPANRMQQCAIVPIEYKIDWKPSLQPKRCYVVGSGKKLRATLKELGWQGNVLPRIDWAKQAAVVDVSDVPYANVTAHCVGLFADDQAEAAVFRWTWVEVPGRLSPASKAAGSKRANADERSIEEQLKDAPKQVVQEVKQLPKDAVDTAKTIAEDVKSMPSPAPRRQTAIATFAKAMLTTTPAINCEVK